MNVKITHNWLLEYLDTDATPSEIQSNLSLCGPSIERVDKVDGDFVYEIEITTNRIDSASVFGIAQESNAILPMFGKKAKIIENPLDKYKFLDINVGTTLGLSLQIQITDPKLCPRFTAIVLTDVEIKPSPDFMQKRLKMCGIKSINNVVDISNYLMLSLGQPTHIFDYDQISKDTMIMRESKKGEKIVTLDEKEITLPGGDIVIEDGQGRLIDLCGIMGGLNSSVTDKTKNILLFVQTYNKTKIRKTSMLTGQRTVAASYFEKGLDPQRVEPALVYGIELLKKYTNAKVSSKVFDIYPSPYRPKKITVTKRDIDRIIGVEIEEKTIVSILQNLGFSVETRPNFAEATLGKHGVPQPEYIVTVPSYRAEDINIKEDLVEEVARVYGYYKLPNNIQPTIYIPQPKDIQRFFTYQQKIKYYLKHIGLNEVLNYSMISRKQIEDLNENPKNYLRLTNTLSEDIEFLRKSLAPSLIKNIKDNTGKREDLHFFELAKVYLPNPTDLPTENYKLGFAANSDFYTVKGVIESIFKEFNIDGYEFKRSNQKLYSQIQTEIFMNDDSLGFIGQLSEEYKLKNAVQDEVILAELDFATLLKYLKVIPQYKAINPYAVIKLDWTTEISPQKTFADIQKKAFQTPNLLKNLEVIDIYKNKITIRFYFTSTQKNITEEEAKNELQKIQENLK